jgi:hypothetical protein
MTDEIVVEETKKETKKGKWTYEKAIAYLSRNGHKVGEKQVKLSDKAGIAAFGCCDYLQKQHKFEIFYSGHL